MNTIRLQDLIQLARKFRFLIIALSFITSTIYSYFYFTNEQQNHNFFIKIDYQTSENYSFVNDVIQKIKSNKFSIPSEIYFNNLLKINKGAFYNEFLETIDKISLNDILDKKIINEFDINFIHKKLLQLLFNETNIAEFKIKVNNQQIPDYTSLIHDYISKINEEAKLNLSILIKEDSKNYQNLQKIHLPLIENEIFHDHIKSFQKDVLETLYYLNLYDNKNQEDEAVKVFENMNDSQKSLYLNHLIKKDSFLLNHHLLYFEILNLNKYYNLSLLNFKIDSYDFKKNTKKYINKLYEIYTKNLEIIDNIIKDEKPIIFNYPSLKQDKISNFVFSQYPDVNENIKSYFRFTFYTSIITNYFSNFSIDNEVEFIKFIDIEKNRNQLAIFIDTLTLFIIIFIASAFFYFFILSNYIILFSKNKKVDE